jgi:hypothetical protein
VPAVSLGICAAPWRRDLRKPHSGLQLPQSPRDSSRKGKRGGGVRLRVMGFLSWMMAALVLAPLGGEAVTADDCTAKLTVGDVSTPLGCWIDEKVSHRSSTLRYKCGGGAGRADFGAWFVGSVSRGGDVVLSSTTTFPWSDGCTWQSTQRIEGALASKALSYSYSERPIAGTSCMPTRCTGSANVAVE